MATTHLVTAELVQEVGSAMKNRFADLVNQI